MRPPLASILDLPKIQFRAYKGEDTDSPTLDWNTGQPINAWRRQVNLRTDHGGGLRYIGNTDLIVDTTEAPSSTLAIVDYDVQDDVVVTYDKYICMVRYGNAGSQFWVYNEATGPPAGEQPTFDTAPIDSRYGQAVKFAKFDSRLFISGLETSPGTGNERLWVWDGPGTPVRPAGLNAPTSFITPTDIGAGNLNNVNKTGYQWLWTVEDMYGNESSPSASGAVLENVNDRKYEFQNLGDAALADLVDSGFITTVHIYRLGGDLGYYRRVVSFSPTTFTATQWKDVATGNFPVDDTADIDAGLQTVSFSNQPPPLGIVDVITHQDRLFAITKDGKLYFSRPGKPESFGYDDNGVDDDGGYIRPDFDTSDEFYQLSSTGNILILGRSRSIYAVYGSGFDTLSFDKRSNTGLSHRHSLIRRDNQSYFIGNDARVYEIGNQGQVWLSDRVQSRIQQDPAAFLTSTLMYSRENLVLAMSASGAAQCMVYNTFSSMWWELGEIGEDEPLSVPDFWLIQQGAWFVRGQENNSLYVLRDDGGIYKVLQEDVVDTIFQVSLESAKLPFSPEYPVWRIIGVVVEGFDTFQTPDHNLQFTIETDNHSEVFGLANLNGPVMFYRSRFSPLMIGDWVRVKMAGEASRINIDNIILLLQPQRSRHRG